jgi:tetratricopeptide (TPR) repeat protein
MRLLLLLLPLLALSGCAASHAYRDGLDLAQGGAPYAAAARYLDALDADPDHRKARAALDAVVDEAYTTRLGEARDAEDAHAWVDARAGYQDLQAFVARLGTHGAGFETLDLAARVAAVDTAAAEEAYVRAEAALAGKDFAGAVDAWRAALAILPGYRDAGVRTADTLHAWGESEQAAGKWRSAAGRFMEARDAGHASGAARAAAIYNALGNSFVWSGHCRQAVRDLRLARTLAGPSTDAVDVETAEACAATPLVVAPFEDAIGAKPAGIALPEAAADSLAASLRAGATPFVQFLERDALERILAEQRIATASTIAPKGAAARAAVPAAPSRLPRAHWLVIGKFTQVRASVPPLAAVPAEVVGRHTCAPPPTDGNVAPPCVPEAPLRYSLREGRGEVRLAGSVRVVDARTGVQAGLWPFDVVRGLDVRFADPVLDAAGRAVSLVRDGVDDPGAWQVPSELLALREAPRVLPDESVLTRDALDAVCAEAAARTLALLDVEAPAQDPIALTVVPIE